MIIGLERNVNIKQIDANIIKNKFFFSPFASNTAINIISELIKKVACE